MTKDFNDMTSQELFEFIVKGLFQQGRQCIDEDGTCYYRGDESGLEDLKGLKCGVGMVIRDEDYLPTLELNEFKDLLYSCRIGASPNQSYLDKNREMLQYIQDIHDNKRNWLSEESLKAAFRLCAGEYGINPSFIDGLTLDSKVMSRKAKKRTTRKSGRAARLKL